MNNLDLLKRAYTVLADIRHDWPGRCSMQGQALLCDLRDAIAKETGDTGENVSSGVQSAIVRDALARRA